MIENKMSEIKSDFELFVSNLGFEKSQYHIGYVLRIDKENDLYSQLRVYITYDNWKNKIKYGWSIVFTYSTTIFGKNSTGSTGYIETYKEFQEFILNWIKNNSTKGENHN